MGEDSDSGWLKKKSLVNPIRMSLRRSNHFYARSPDMDASLMPNPGNAAGSTKTQLIGPRRRKTNIPMVLLQEVGFKIPAPVQEKAVAKRPTAGIPRPTGYVFKPRDSVLPKKDVKETLTFKANISVVKSADDSVQRNPKCSLLNAARRSVFVPAASTTRRTKKPNIGRFLRTTESGTKYNSDTSITGPSRSMNQSTPNETPVTRSILKQSQSRRQLQFSRIDPEEKPKASKKVNFTEAGKTDAVEENPEDKKIPNGKDENGNSDEETVDKPHNYFSALEESTIAFSDCFGPITNEDNKQTEKDGKFQLELPQIKIDSPKTETELRPNGNNQEKIILSWKSYYRIKLEMDETLKSFQNILDENKKKTEIREIFRVQKQNSYRLRQIAEEIVKLNDEIEQSFNNDINLEPICRNYLEKLKNYSKEQEDLYRETEKFLESRNNEENGKRIGTNFKKPQEIPSDKLRGVSEKSKCIKKKETQKFNYEFRK